MDNRPALNKIGPMTVSAHPPGFDTSRPPTPEELKALPTVSHEALHVLERCISDHHVAEVDYRAPQERQEMIRFRPAFIRTSSAHNIVVWGIPDGDHHWMELRLDRIRGVRDTGDVFQPTW
jgi:hypothetical protein